jgi:hypothetical protein
MKVDMSPEAVTSRLNAVEALRQLCLSLGRRRHASAPSNGAASGPDSDQPANQDLRMPVREREIKQEEASR